MEFKSVEGKDVIENERFLLQSHAAWVSLNEMTSCNPELKITSDQLESAVEKLKVPLNRLHPDGMGGVVVGPERNVPKYRSKRVIDKIKIVYDGCWEWTGCRFKFGYGRINVVGHRLCAHRLVFSLVFGLKPELLVCHHCDNPVCVNPFHLYLGTAKDNRRDAVVRGRTNAARGEATNKSSLTERDVREIKANPPRIRGDLKRIAGKYGISTTAISSILNGTNWKYVS